MSAPITTALTCCHEWQVRVNGMWMTELCTVPAVAGQPRCADHGRPCVCCGEQYAFDPVFPENETCGDC